MSSLRILFVTPYVPSLLRARPYRLIAGLQAEGHRVTLVTAYATEAERVGAEALRDACDRLVAVRVPRLRSLWNCARAVVGSRLPLQAVYMRSPAFAAAVHGAVHAARDARLPYDLLHVEHLRAALTGLDVPGLPRIYDAVDCMTHLYDKTRRMSGQRRSRVLAGLDAARTRRFEARLGQYFDRVLVSSPVEQRVLAALATDAAAADRVVVLPNGVDLDYFHPCAGPRDPATLVFVGRLGYHANINAVVQVIRDILPLIRAQRPDVRFVVVGPDVPPLLRRAARHAAGRIRFEGYVPDVRPYLGRATVAVAPFVYAVGMQNKIIEAMAMGTPVVTTPDGAAGLDVRDGEHLLVGADPPAFAQQVLRLLGDPLLRERIAAAGCRYVVDAHDSRAVTRRVIEVYEQSIAEYSQRRGTPIVGPQ